MKVFLDRNFYLKSFEKKIRSKEKKFFWEKRKIFVKEIFNDKHSENEIINLLEKRYDINEKDDVFCWLCSNKVGHYCIFLRICELASNCCVKKHEKGFDIIVNKEKNKVLIDDMNKWVLNRWIHKMSYSNTEKISSYRIYHFKNHDLF